MTLLDKVKAVGGVVHDYHALSKDGLKKWMTRVELTEQQLQALIDRELAQYQSAIVEKDKALEMARCTDGVYRDAFERNRICKKALAIKPDTSALKALIGEPVGYVSGDVMLYEKRIPADGAKLYAVKVDL